MEAFVETAEEAAGFDVRTMAGKLLTGKLSLDEDTINRWIWRLAASVRKGLLDALSALAAPVLASIAVKALLGEKAGEGAIALLCRLNAAAILTVRFTEAQNLCETALDRTLKLTNAAAPVLVSAHSLTGSAEAAILTPSAALCATLIEALLVKVALPLTGVAAIVAASANLSVRFRLNRLFALLRRAITWGVSLMLSGFVELLALQGLLAGGQDALSARAIRRAIQSALPIVGGEFSDSAGAILISALSVRNLAGVTGMLAVLGASAAPMLRLMASTLSLRLSAAALEPVADRSLTRIVGHFGDLHRMLLAICASGTLLAVLTLGALLGLAGG